MNFPETDLRKQKIGSPNIHYKLTLLYPIGPPIKTAKYGSLQELLQFIPPVYHNFYASLHQGIIRNIASKRHIKQCFMCRGVKANKRKQGLEADPRQRHIVAENYSSESDNE